MSISEAKRKLYEVIKHFDNVTGAGTNEKEIIVYLKEEQTSFIKEFEGFKVKVEVIGEIKLQ